MFYLLPISRQFQLKYTTNFHFSTKKVAATTTIVGSLHSKRLVIPIFKTKLKHLEIKILLN